MIRRQTIFVFIGPHTSECTKFNTLGFQEGAEDLKNTMCCFSAKEMRTLLQVQTKDSRNHLILKKTQTFPSHSKDLVSYAITP